MAKRPLPAAARPITTHADARPRVYFRIVAGAAQVSGNTSGPWLPAADIIEAIDAIAGEGAHERPAVIIWEGIARG